MEKERRTVATTTTRTTMATPLRTVSSPTPSSSRRSYPPHRPHSCTVILGKTSRMTSRRRRYALTSAIARNLQWPRAKYASSIFAELSPYTGKKLYVQTLELCWEFKNLEEKVLWLSLSKCWILKVPFRIVSHWEGSSRELIFVISLIYFNLILNEFYVTYFLISQEHIF